MIHSTDGDPVMIEHLARQARRLQVPLDGVAPLSSGGRGVAVDPRRFLYNWQDLNRLPDGYDYVMCRGNSLAYANSWAGGRRVTRLAHIAEHLGRMAAKVRPGGWLHVDAPREEDTLDSPIIYPAHGQVAAISEQVTIGADHRVWHLSFKYTTGRVVEFERYSSLLTIEGVEQMLRDLEFEDTEPIELEDERPNFGVIIARRPG